MDDDRISPLCFNERTRELMIVNKHMSGNTVRRHRHIVDCQKVLLSTKVEKRLWEVYFYSATGIGSAFVIVCIDVVVSPTLSVGGTVDAR